MRTGLSADDFMKNRTASLDRLSQIMLYAVLFLLTLFLATGIFFMIKDSLGAGFVGCGVFLFGMGLVILLQTMVMEEDGSFFATFGLSSSGSAKPSHARSGDDLDYDMKFNVDADFGEYGREECFLYLCADGLYFDRAEEGLLDIPFSGIASMTQEKKFLSMDCSYVYDGMERSHTIGMTADNALRFKALISELKKQDGFTAEVV